jgi:acyl transferase domain-containing protein/thioesterase domain-containing protein/acyl carrier protein
MSNQDILDTLSGAEIAVVGMAGRFPGADDVDTFWENIRDGVESIQRYSDDELRATGVDEAMLRNPNYIKAGAPLNNMEMFDAGFFGFGPRDAAIMDPQHRHFLEVCWEALEHAGYDPARFEGSVGVFGGSGMNAYMPYNLFSNPDLMQSVGLFLIRHTGNDKDFMTTRVSYLLNLKGPSVNVQTACSTSLVAIHLGVQSLLNRETDMVLAGGVTIEMPHHRGYVYHEGEILSPDGHCRAFDAKSKGTVFGSGVGVVVLKRLEDAILAGDSVHAVIKGSAINNDGSGKVNYLAPSVDGQAASITEALALAGVEADTVSYVETHGTGTPIGDPIEVTALTQAFRTYTDKRNFCGIGSLKTNIGHLDTAAGVASFIKAVQALKHKQLPPSLNFEKPNPMIDFENSPFYVNARLQDWKTNGTPRRAGVSSLGVGGTNAHIVLEEAPELDASGESRHVQLLMLSAKSGTALDNMSANLVAYFRKHPDINLADAAYTLQVGRQHFNHRRIVAVHDVEDAINALESRDAKRVISHSISEQEPSVVFMFAGGGAQYPNMGRELYETEPVYRDTVDECLRLLKNYLKDDLKPLMFPDEAHLEQAASTLERATYALPALFITEYALAKLWMSWGVQPAAMTGHSLGEYTAACLAGVMSLKDALSIVTLRGVLFDTLPEGAMLSVPLGEDELRPLLNDQISIGAINAPGLCMASGSVQAIHELETQLAAQGIQARRLKISVAAHSHMLEPVLEKFHQGVAAIKLNKPTMPYITNVTGTWVKAEDVIDPAYWVRHLRNTVRFADGVTELLKEPNRVFLEVGPGNTLVALARMQMPKNAKQFISSLRHPQDNVSDLQFFLTALGQLWLNGYRVSWDAFYADERRHRIPLPTYPFDHQRYWIEPGKQMFTESAKPALAKMSNLSDWFYRPAWKRADLTGATSLEKQRWLVFLDEVGLGAQIVKRLEEDGHDVYTIKTGYEFAKRGAKTYAIDPRSAEDYGELVKDLLANNAMPQRIAHLWNVTPEKPIQSRLAFFEQSLNTGFYSLLFLVQAFANEGLSDSIRISIIANGMQQVAGENVPYPEKATLLGPVKVIPQEFPEITCQAIDVVLPKHGRNGRSNGVEAVSVAEQLIAELINPAAESLVAYRGGGRWIQHFEPVPLDSTEGKKLRLRQNGVYLITGGLGGIGLVQAEYLAKNLRAKLVLTSRSGLPARKEWKDWLKNHPEHDKTSRQIRKVQSLEALGAEVLVAKADVSDRNQMRAAITSAKEQFGAIHGVIHAAGVLDDNLIQLKTPGSAEQVFAPKVRGTLLLDDLLKDTPLDFFVLFSSTSTVIAPAGQIDYVGANAFLNAFADSKAAQGGAYTVAINWGVWSGVGMAAESAAKLGLGSAADAELGVPMQHPLLDKLIIDTPDSRVYATEYSVDDFWILDQHRIKGGEALIPGTGYLEIAKAALDKGEPQYPAEIRELFFMSPLDVRASERKEVRVTLDKSGSVYNFAVTSKVIGGLSDWQEHVRGKIGYVRAAAPKPLDIDAILARCNRQEVRFSPGQQHTRQEDHLDFGPRWKNLRQMNFGQGEALAALELLPEFWGDLNEFFLHPALIDLATGYALPLVEGYETSDDFYVPISYKSVRIYAPLSGRIYSYARCPDPTSREVVIVDITLADEEGNVLVEINEFMMKRISDKSILRARPEDQPSQSAARTGEPTLLELSLTEGILPDEGIEAFSRVLAANVAPQIIVSSLDLKTLMDYTAKSAKSAEETGLKLSRPNLGNDYEAPTSEVEKTLVRMWEGLLGVDQVGVNDNFFELGGHSLIAVRLFSQIKKTYGVDLSLGTLFQAPTIAQAAELIQHEKSEEITAQQEGREKRSSHSNLIVGIQTKGEKPPFICIHDMNGHVLYYRDLARHLGNDQPFYAVQAVGLDGKQDFDTSVEAMGARYVKEIRAFQPSGPYYLGGSSLGGLVAFDVAQRLLAEGETVALLALFDSWTPQYLSQLTAPHQETESTGQKASKHWRNILQRGPAYFMERIRSRIGWAKYKIEYYRLKSMKLRRDFYLKSGRPMPEDLRAFHMEEIYGHAYRNYTAQPYDGKMTLFVATERLLGETDMNLGWTDLTPGGLEVHMSPGPHGFMVRDPHAEILADKLRDCLERAQAAPENLAVQSSNETAVTA